MKILVRAFISILAITVYSPLVYGQGGDVSFDKLTCVRTSTEPVIPATLLEKKTDTSRAGLKLIVTESRPLHVQSRTFLAFAPSDSKSIDLIPLELDSHKPGESWLSVKDPFEFAIRVTDEKKPSVDVAVDKTSTRRFAVEFEDKSLGAIATLEFKDSSNYPLTSPISQYEMDRNVDRPRDQPNAARKLRFHWKSAIKTSLVFVSIQHSVRLLQGRTRDALKGPFFRDWGRAVRGLRGWEDGDSWWTNEIKHSMQGSTTGRIFVNNSEKSRIQEFGKSGAYWRSRLKALAWSAAWSAQFELGPISEATIGNVGYETRHTHPFSHMSYQDLVITPTIGTAFLVVEDMIDKYILKNWLERRAKTRMGVRLLRMFVTPLHAFTNTIGARLPWKRYTRR